MKNVDTWTNALRSRQALLAARPLPILRVPVGEFTPPAFIAVVWILAALLVNPLGEFPLNDDWAYAASVRTLLEDGEFRLSNWTATNLLVQVLWGAMFCLPFGFSFTALRISTLLLGLAGMLATYALLREARAGRKIALLGACSLGFNPIYFSLSFTFMTDVPFAAFAAGSSWLIIRGIRRDSLATALFGLALAFAALLIRQVGLAVPIAFGVAWLIRHREPNWFRNICIAALPAICGLALQLGYQFWLASAGKLPAKFGNQISTLITQINLPWQIVVWDAASIIAISSAYLGLFLAPFLLTNFSLRNPRRQCLDQIGVAAGALIITALLVLRGKLMPLHGNILTQGGIGWDVPAAPKMLWLAATFVALFGGIVIIAAVLRALGSLATLVASGREPSNQVTLGFALSAIAIAFAPLPFLGLGPFGFYDRYLIVFLPWLLLILVVGRRFWPGEISVAMFGVGAFALAGMAAFSIMATHDYLDAQRSRWTALHDLMHRCGVPPDDISDGFEFHGWFLAESVSLGKLEDILWSGIGDDYVVQFWSVRDEYSELARFPVNWWLPWGMGDMISQRRAALGPGPCASLKRDLE